MKTLKLRLVPWVAFLALFVTLIAAPFNLQARPKPTGVAGQVLLHNNLVITIGGERGVTSPFSASFQIYSATTGRFIKSAATDPMGRFEVKLQPGDYLIVPDAFAQGRVLPPGSITIGHYEAAEPVEVSVRKHRLTELTIIYEEMMGN